MSRLTDFFWPTLEKPTPAEVEDDDSSERSDIEAARNGGWAQCPELALEEARRLADSEEDRRRTTEGKASTYLLFAAAFAAALIPFLPGILEGKTGSAPRWLIAIILVVAALYLMAAGIWAFRTLRVGTYHRLDVAELAHIWRHKNPRRALIREALVLARMNYHAVNEKVSCLKMSHEFMARSFLAFGILIAIEAGWEAAHSVIETPAGRVVAIQKKKSKPVESGGGKSTPPGLGSPSASAPSSGAKPSPNGTVSSTITPGTDLSSRPAGSVEATKSATNTSAKLGSNGPIRPAEGSPGKQ